MLSTTTWRFTPRLSLDGIIGVGYDERRRDDDGVQSGSESVAAYLIWTRPLRRSLVLGINAGGNIGLFEPETGGVSFAYGARAAVNVTWTRSSLRLIGRYTGSFADNVDSGTLATVPGWTLSQQLLLSADGQLKSDLGGRAQLSVLGSRREDPLLGSFANTTATAMLGLSGRRYTLLLTGGLTEGASAAVGNPLASDGLFLPAAYNSEDVFASLTATESFDRGRLVLSELARAAWIRAPGHPDSSEVGLIVSASYRMGKFLFTIDERLSWGGVAGSSQFGNVFMVRASRSFSLSF